MNRQATTQFAHFTDPHLPLLRGDLRPWTALAGKRVTGALSWWKKRRHIHRPEVTAQLVADIHAHRPDQILITGDIVNISLPSEFGRASQWLSQVGSPRDVMVVPGNHDAYVAMNWSEGLAQWAAYCAGDRAEPLAPGQEGYPTLRIRGSAALVGVSTATPHPVFSAAGSVGAAQLARLENLLDDLAKKGLFRIVLMHHPPGQAGIPGRKGLSDRRQLLEVLNRVGAELIIHGHTHRATFDNVPGPLRPVTILAPGSASSVEHELASWHLLSLQDLGGMWQVQVEARGLDPATFQPKSLGSFTVPAGPLNNARSS